MANPAASFAEGTISRWLEEALAVFAAHCEGPQVVIGSSMGGWMALLLAREIGRHPERYRGRLAALVLIAPAPDFTEALMWNGFSPEIRAQIETAGQWLRPSEYGEPYPITKRADRGRPQASPAGRARSRSVARCGSCKAGRTPTCRGATPSR